MGDSDEACVNGCCVEPAVSTSLRGEGSRGFSIGAEGRGAGVVLEPDPAAKIEVVSAGWRDP